MVKHRLGECLTNGGNRQGVYLKTSYDCISDIWPCNANERVEETVAVVIHVDEDVTSAYASDLAQACFDLCHGFMF
ncbi:hypothetical protein SAMN05216359_102548 [Roseateles sp. YR242]|nr:hypothetical protein SAMN05216359_102548 [Roseateles sp. YR242]